MPGLLRIHNERALRTQQIAERVTIDTDSSMSCEISSLFFLVVAVLIAVAIIAEWIPANSGVVSVGALALFGAAVPRLYQALRR